MMRISTATTARPMVKPRIRLVAPDPKPPSRAGKSGIKAACGVSTLACVLIAAKRLPRVWLKTHVMMTENDKTDRRKMGRFVTKGVQPVPGPPP